MMVGVEHTSSKEYDEGILDSDVDLSYGASFWVGNGTLNNLFELPGSMKLPPSGAPFPYARLATNLKGDRGDFYVYHQVNDTSLVEDLFDNSIGHFTSTYINIETD